MSGACENGYFDPMGGLCVCSPGWRGFRCEQAYLSACRLSTLSPYMACQGFNGLMSCLCKWQCWKLLGLHGVKAKPCFELNKNTDLQHLILANLSDFPADESMVVYRVRLNGPATTREKISRLLGTPGTPLFPVPNANCPFECSSRGTCTRTAKRGVARCLCHAGFQGVACERSLLSECINNCSGRGHCINRFCFCEESSFGVDCSLSVNASRFVSGGNAPDHAPVYVYTLPSELSLQVAPVQKGPSQLSSGVKSYVQTRPSGNVPERPDQKGRFLCQPCLPGDAALATASDERSICCCSVLCSGHASADER